MKLSFVRKFLSENPNCPIVKYNSPLQKLLKEKGSTYICLKKCKKGKVSVTYCGGKPPSGWMGDIWDLTKNKDFYIRGNGFGNVLFIHPLPKN